MGSRRVPMGADAERARMLAAEQDRRPWRRWAPSVGPGGLPGIVDELHGIRLDLAFGLADGGPRSSERPVVEYHAAAPTFSYLRATVELPAGPHDTPPCLLDIRFAKRAPEDIVIALTVVAGFGIGHATVDLGVSLSLAVVGDVAETPSAGGGRPPSIRSAWEAQGPGLPGCVPVLCAERPGCGTWWLAADVDARPEETPEDAACTLRQRMQLAPGEARALRLRLVRGAGARSPVDADASATLGTRARESAAYDASLGPVGAIASRDLGRDTSAVLAGLAWAPAPGATATDAIMASVALAVGDPVTARRRLLECLEDPSRVGPAVEPPIGAWAASRIHEMGEALTGRRDHGFLERTFQALLDDYSRWVDRLDVAGRNALHGGLLELDGMSSSAAGAAWMGCYSVWMLSLAIELARDDPTYQDATVTFLEMSLAMVAALDDMGGSGTGMWDEAAGVLRDVTLGADGEVRRSPECSAVGLVPLLAVARIPREALDRLPDVSVRLNWSMHHREVLAGSVLRQPKRGGRSGDALVSLVPADRWRRALSHAHVDRADMSPALACLLLDAIDRVRAFDPDLVPASVGQALAAHLAADPSSPPWATLLMQAMRRAK